MIMLGKDKSFTTLVIMMYYTSCFVASPVDFCGTSGLPLQLSGELSYLSDCLYSKESCIK